MRNKGKILLLALTLLCCAAFAVYQYRYLRTADREPPKISMAQQELTLSVSDPDTRLLEGMSAADARDGDVTPSMWQRRSARSFIPTIQARASA